jgi:glycosyltransferase involved in cell wall biosynthesis
MLCDFGDMTMEQARSLRVGFFTSTPLNREQGSGTFVGITTLAAALRAAGVDVDIVSPGFSLPVLAAQRWVYNRNLAQHAARFDITVGFDLDGYRLARRSGPPHVAAIKGVIADELRFERGLTRANMALQAKWEHRHVSAAARVVTTSRYSAARIQQLYGVPTKPGVVPELIDLANWRDLLRRNQATPDAHKFVVLCVCRLYRRKRVDLLLHAAALLRRRIPHLEIRIAGSGPEYPRLVRLWRSLELQEKVRWLGNLDPGRLAREYGSCHVFSLPSVQEGFGIVFLEAMAAEKPIVAARAAAVPEVCPNQMLVEPESAEALADGIETLFRNPETRGCMASSGARFVERFDAPCIGARFLRELHAGVHLR